MEIRYIEGKKKNPTSTMRVEAWEGEQCVSSIQAVTTRPTRYHSEWISTMTIGGVATPPEHRRGGYVKAMLNDLYAKTEEKG